MTTALGTRRRVAVRVTGTVQGVGFRPFVFRVAEELDLAGWVLNDERGVELEVEGAADRVESFLARLRSEAPPLAHVGSIDSAPVAVTGERGFRIVESASRGEADAQVAPDSATCDDCLSELFDPGDRRHRYPFINCTNCGPRFTIVEGVPYDRARTTMSEFAMCAACRAEYDDPRDRRFHAQPNACPACGPTVRLVEADGRPITASTGEPDPIATAARLLGEGAIVAVKGLGGYHLACLAGDELAVDRLRARKHRDQKPLALMAPSLEAARELVELTWPEERLLVGRQRPIVIARRRADAPVGPAVAPRSHDLGVMLAYSPLHHLLARDVGRPLVMTSGNVSDEPIAYDDADAHSRLAGIADAFLVGNRRIHIRTDDSVARSLSPGVGRAPLLIRRSRGYVPGAIRMPVSLAEPVLGCGAELKSTFCLAKSSRAWVSHHIGDLKNFETLISYRDGIEHYERVFAVEPTVVAHDEHPDYLATRYALERGGVKTVAVQHHHAHLAACLAEHGQVSEAIGAIFDGAGHGPDGTVWGGEILVGDLSGYRRAGFLFPVRLPGGDAAAREPWRMACAWLAVGEPEPQMPAALRADVSESDWTSVCGLVESGVASPLTTSAGRLFDAVAAICGLRARVSHEGQAAMELEGSADPSELGAYEVPLIAEPGGPTVIDARPAVFELVADLARGAAVGAASARFHNGLGDATAGAVALEAERTGLTTAVLSGGVFQNRLLLERVAARLRRVGLEVLIPEQLPPNDGQISYGQVAVAAARPGGDCLG
jgi:hydrogenase maturation protein HypF